MTSLSTSNVFLPPSTEDLLKITKKIKQKYRYVEGAKMSKGQFYQFLSTIGINSSKQHKETMEQLFKPEVIQRLYIIGLEEISTATPAPAPAPKVAKPVPSAPVEEKKTSKTVVPKLVKAEPADEPEEEDEDEKEEDKEDEDEDEAEKEEEEKEDEDEDEKEDEKEDEDDEEETAPPAYAGMTRLSVKGAKISSLNNAMAWMKFCVVKLMLITPEDFKTMSYKDFRILLKVCRLSYTYMKRAAIEKHLSEE